jgi:hypothetical protein
LDLLLMVLQRQLPYDVEQPFLLLSLPPLLLLLLLLPLLLWPWRCCCCGPHLGADLGGVCAQRLQHARGHALALAQQAQQDVLRADVVVAWAGGRTAAAAAAGGGVSGWFW